VCPLLKHGRGESVERPADKLRAGRRVAPSMLHQCPCGRIDSFIGLFDGVRRPHRKAPQSNATAPVRRLAI
jgi:hypothetical protein